MRAAAVRALIVGILNAEFNIKILNSNFQILNKFKILSTKLGY